ncbi:MerR family transcriptional regulator [Methylobacterium sp. Leaf117]|uniref:MerR family transcriptional regulator n=1 Tax=Methylobacterium sp. Leaf117 TaxID=1736260 RepID=UPI0007002E73|nr:MerR family transcriptional regulator [Methylobacterium sp. Leaf117]KQP91975.1 MerR family transcriptional regulator [Methylobacterium sp. Leaf117]
MSLATRIDDINKSHCEGAPAVQEALEKSAGAFRTIKEAADELDVPQHVLRFWETRFAQIRPIKRAGGRRYYRPEDVALLKGIKRLLHGQGYTIKGAQRVLRERGLRFVQSVGRGEAVVAAPSIQDADVDVQHVVLPAAEPLSPKQRAVLVDVLGDLQACREAIAHLRRLPESKAGS